jgi:hypothetical protein
MGYFISSSNYVMKTVYRQTLVVKDTEILLKVKTLGFKIF